MHSSLGLVWMMRQGPFPAGVISVTPINLKLISRYKTFFITQTRNLPPIIPLQTTTCSNVNEQSIFRPPPLLHTQLRKGTLLLLRRPTYNEKCIFNLNI